MKRLFLVVLFLLAPVICSADTTGVLVTEEDGSPAGFAYKVQVTNGALSLASGVATVSLSAGSGDVTGLFDCVSGDCPTITAENGDTLTYTGTGIINANQFAGVSTVDATEFTRLNGLSAAIQTVDADLTTLAAPTAWRVFYSNATSVMTELALGAAGTVLYSNGASAAPTWEATAGDITSVFNVTSGAATAVTVGTGQSLGYSGTGTVAATTAAALAASPGTCAAGEYAAGITAAGEASGCTADDDAPDSDAEVPNAITVDGGTINNTIIGAGGAAAATITTLAAGAGAMLVDADGDTTAKSVTIAKQSGVAGLLGVYEANGTETKYVAWKGPAGNLAGSLELQFPDAQNTAGQGLVFAAPSVADPAVSVGSWVDGFAVATGIVGTNAEKINNGTDTEIEFDGDEDFTIDLDTATDNEVLFKSDTGVTQVNFSALNMVTTGSILGAIKIISDANDYIIAAAEAYGFLGVSTGAGTWTLPDVCDSATGANGCVYAAAAHNVILDLPAEDNFVYEGVAETDAEALDSDDAAGEFICVVCAVADEWHVLGHTPGWTGE